MSCGQRELPRRHQVHSWGNVQPCVRCTVFSNSVLRPLSPWIWFSHHSPPSSVSSAASSPTSSVALPLQTLVAFVNISWLNFHGLSRFVNQCLASCQSLSVASLAVLYDNQIRVGTWLEGLDEIHDVLLRWCLRSRVIHLKSISTRLSSLFSVRFTISMCSSSLSDVYFQCIVTRLVDVQSLSDFRAGWVDDDDVTLPVGCGLGRGMTRALVNSVLEDESTFSTRKWFLSHLHSPVSPSHSRDPRPGCLHVRPIFDRRGSLVSGDSETIRARTAVPMPNRLSSFRPEMVPAPTLTSTWSSRICDLWSELPLDRCVRKHRTH